MIWPRMNSSETSRPIVCGPRHCESLGGCKSGVRSQESGVRRQLSVNDKAAFMNTRSSKKVIEFLSLLVLTSAVATQPANGQASKPKSQAELIAVLRSDAPEAEKAMVCKELSLYGSSEAIPELAKLLANERLSSWARIPLEAMPGSAADEALRTAAGQLQGRLLVGVINSIGVRRDAAAVDLLSSRLADKDAEVASA